MENLLGTAFPAEGDAFVDSLHTGETLVRLLNVYRAAQADAFRNHAASASKSRNQLLAAPQPLAIVSMGEALPSVRCWSVRAALFSILAF
jgi:hypothetical protein